MWIKNYTIFILYVLYLIIQLIIYEHIFWNKFLDVVVEEDLILFILLFVQNTLLIQNY